MGLNLIGASRLILYDVDWNPANDLQVVPYFHSLELLVIHWFCIGYGSSVERWAREEGTHL